MAQAKEYPRLRDMELKFATSFAYWATIVPDEHGRTVFHSQAEECLHHARVLNSVIALQSGCEEELPASPPPSVHELEGMAAVKAVIMELLRHLKIERGLAETYRALSEMAEDIRIRTLLRNLAEDENRHHDTLKKLLDEMEKRYRSTYPELFDR